MKNNQSAQSTEKGSNVKEISDGVYINLSRITSDKRDFEKDIEESFKKLDEDENRKGSHDEPSKSNA
ncbi:hypothetical protein FLAN108750_10260 [Flavobacterium antarcticum]|uniref:hypothetical protein n=1 Tax=Flavobacterium antarcticum TaxID=271155 RepID=UPI0003B37D19|nr:hypothetical protein [Flavobacterium antarcticum]